MVEVSTAKLKRQLQQMDPYEFEELVAEVWGLRGYQTTVRRGSGDRGIDVEATVESPYSEKVLIQAKRYSGKTKVGSGEVRRYATLYQQVPDADTVIIVTSGAITSDAQGLAQDLRVEIVDGDSFAEMVADNKRKLSLNLRTKSHSQNRQKKTNRTPFNKCPNCKSYNLQMEGSNIITCIQCHSKWQKDHTGYTLKWRGVSGDVKGKLGTTDEWKHHYNDIEFTQVGVEESENVENPPEEISQSPANIKNQQTNMFDSLAGAGLFVLLFSSIHSLLSWSFHSYQYGVVILVVIFMSISTIIKSVRKD